MPDETVDLLKLENQVCFALAVAARSVIGLYRPVLQPLELTHPQYLVMLALWERSPRSVRELGEVLQLEPATLSPLLKRLETLGYLTRERSSTDERMLEITLTDAGAALRASAEQVPATIFEQLGMGAGELAELREALGRITAASQRAHRR